MLGQAFFLSPGYPLRSLDDILANSPSREHGLSAEQERAMIRTAINMIIGAGQKLQMDHLAIATAVVYLQRFYAIKSLLTNDYFVISIACLYLGGKVEDTPKSVRDVLYACFEWRFKGRQEVLRRLYDKDFYEPAKERVFTAERTIMYALGFEFNISHVIVELIEFFKEGPVAQLRNSLAQADAQKAQGFVQNAYSLANDSLKTSLCLQYRADQVAAGVVWMLLSLYRLEVDTLDPRTGQPWWASYHLSPEALDDITSQMLQLYEPLPPGAENAAQQQQQFASSTAVWQGTQEGRLLLYNTHLMSTEQHQRAHPPPQPPPQLPQPQLQAPPTVAAAGGPASARPQPQLVGAAGAAADPSPQPEAPLQPAVAEEEDEYAELFA